MAVPTNKNMTYIGPPPVFKNEMLSLLIWTIVFRFSTFVTIASMFILGILSVPFMVLSIIGQIKAAIEMQKGWSMYIPSQRKLGAAFLIYCFVSMIVGVIYVTMIFTGSLCMLNCSAGQNQIGIILLVIFLFL